MTNKAVPGSKAWLEAYNAEMAAATLVAEAERAVGDKELMHIAQEPMPEEMVTISMPARELAALKAELQAVHSDLGDCSQIIFDLLESVKEKEIELAKERKRTERMEETIRRLKATVESMKSRLAPILPVEPKKNEGHG